ncbi:MAG: CAAD domain-containing protein [Kaiparowitsia implicata GSE-PSE-MK54-09C]|jgi:hypothetical protein|nr:CAAD domain-containing protein [Kaiparowitsia implicata GSE-PSE-MK54-09C]
MDPDVNQETTPIEDFSTPVEDTTPSAFSTPEPDGEVNEQLKDVTDKLTAFLADLPDYLSGFFGEYRRPIVTIGLIVAAIITVKLTLAVLGSVNDVPLLAPTFELIGIGYSAWFIYRYLLKASNRKELASDFNSLKSQVLGQRNNNSL